MGTIENAAMPREGIAGFRGKLGGVEGNERLTIAAAAVLIALLVAEGMTILFIGGLLSVHMFIGLVLIPPVLLKLLSTGYRFGRYYSRAPAYREKGPPAAPLRLLAPVLVVSTIAVFATGVSLLLLGHLSDRLLLLHKAAFFVWAAAFGIHFLAYLPRVVRSLAGARLARGRPPAGAGLRGALIAASLGAGLALALSLGGAISAWHGPLPG
jgi:hypothetical protein